MIKILMMTLLAAFTVNQDPVCPAPPEHAHNITVQRVIITELTECYVVFKYTHDGPSYLRSTEVAQRPANLPKHGRWADIEYCDTVDSVLNVDLKNAVGQP